MVFTRNKLDKYNETLLNKLVEFGGDITYSDGFWIWRNKHFRSVEKMKSFMEFYNINKADVAKKTKATKFEAKTA